jgi:NADH-ubiquinone oxidoreductase chain 4
MLTPLLGAIVVMAMPDKTQKQIESVKTISLWFGIATLALAFYVWAIFDEGVVGYQMTTYSESGGWAIHFGIDGLSLYYVLLTAMLTPICQLASWSNVKHSIRLYNAMQLIACSLLIMVFTQIDLLMFYIAFEAVLIPMFFMIGMWGGSPSRTRSAMLLFLYTLFGSLFMLLAMLNLYACLGTFDMTIMHVVAMDNDMQKVMWLSFAIAMAIKTPLVPFHMWLPRAHADAPLAGSMVLAGTVLKLASYGVLRVMLPMFPYASMYYSPFVYMVAIISLVYASFATMRQSDFKALVAYSSIAHMAVVVMGLFSNTLMGITGAILLSLAHGFISPLMFMLVGGVLYDRYHSRQMRYYRGMATSMPIFGAVMFYAICANMGVPLTLNWLGEWMALAGSFQYSFMAGAFGATSIVLSACYSVWLWARICTGTDVPYMKYTMDVTRREMAVMVPLIIMPLLMGIKPNLLMDVIGSAAMTILY